MIQIKQTKPLYDNDIRVMLQAFYPEEKIVCIQEDTPWDLQAIFYFELALDEAGAKITLTEPSGEKMQTFVTCHYQDKSEAKNPIKLGMYELLSKREGRELPWGSLTGIRPTKVATALLEEGCQKEEVEAYYQKTFAASKGKARICYEVATKEQTIIQSVDQTKQYCLYIGIPFCLSRCLYCSFTSYPIAQYRGKVQAYLEALAKELAFVAEGKKDKQLIAIYMGGGTPTSLSARQLDWLLTKVEEYFDLSYLRELTIEAGRPDSVTPEKFQAMKRHNVTRISINPQTMNDETLRLIGRAHTSAMTREAYEMARKEGFTNINMDMIVGLPGETIEDVKHTLEQLTEMEPESITVHSLAIKRAARLNEQMEQYKALVHGSTNEMLDAVEKTAKSLDMMPYYLYRQKNIPGNLENVGYAKNGVECIYNVLIMEEILDIIAVGAGGSTKLTYPEEHRIERVETVKSVDDYIERIDEMIDRKRKAWS